MAEKPIDRTKQSGKDLRAARLKVALKANIAKRKAQARARKSAADDKGEQA